MLEAKDLTKSFGPTKALDGLNLTVGEAVIDGVNAVSDPAGTKQKLAYIPEQVALYPQLTGLENLDYFMRLAGMKLGQADLLRILRNAGLDDTQSLRRSSTYSKGMRQKVGVGIAVAKNAKALLLDEPLSGLDPWALSSRATISVRHCSFLPCSQPKRQKPH